MVAAGRAAYCDAMGSRFVPGAVARRLRPAGLAVAVVLLGVLLPTGPVTAQAEPPSAAPIGLSVTPSRSDYPAGTGPVLHVRLTNRTSAACGLAATPDLTLAVLAGTVDGQALVPSYLRELPIDGAGSAVAARTKVVAAGGELTFDVEPAGGQGLPVSVGLADGTTLAAWWPLTARGHYELRLSYAMPPQVPVGPGSAPAACAGTSDPATASFTIGAAGTAATPAGGTSWPLVAAAAAVALLLVGLAGWLWLRARRRGRPRAGGSGGAGSGGAGVVAALVLLAAAGVVALDGIAATPAHAGVVYGPDPNKNAKIFDTYTGCMAKIAQFDPGLLTALSGPTVVVYPWTDSKTGERAGGGSKDSLILWDPFTGTGFVGETSGAVYDPCAGLYHELNHARDRAENKSTNDLCDDTGVLVDEVRATIAENRYRAAQRPRLPARTTYDGTKIPSSLSGCTPPKKKADNGDPNPGVCRGIDGPCSNDTGDPHLTTFDGYRYDFQAVGEFVVARSASGDLEIQARQAAFPGSRIVAVNTAVAMRVAGVRLGFYLGPTGLVVHRDGTTVDLPPGTTSLPGGGKVDHAVDPVRGHAFAVVWPDGSAAWVVQVGRWGLQLTVQPRLARTGTVTGLLGTFDHDQTNDVSTVGGKVLAQPPSFDDLYHTLAPGWRVSDATSLFDYPTSMSTKDFTDTTFPDRPSTADTLAAPARDAAQAACALLGVIDPGMLADCLVDVASTGQAMFAVNAMRVQAAAVPAGAGGGSGSTQVGPPQTLSVSASGGNASFSFDGTAGQRVYIDVTSTTLPNSCGVPELVGPGGFPIALGCISGGKGYLDGTLLPATGRYQVLVQPSNGATGTITMRVITSIDLITPIVPDGPAATGTVSVAGQQARLTFGATAGERVFVDIVGSTVPTGCGSVFLAEADSRFAVSIGCISADHTGIIDTTTLVATRSYAIVLDPPVDATGSVTVRLSVVQDQQQAITLDGGAVLATVTQPGAQSLLTFTGTAGQLVTVDGTGGTAVLVGCGGLLLRNANGGTIDLGCIKADGTATMGPTKLPTTGTYTIALDPQARATGSISLRVHT
jgi:VWD domain-containing protein